VIAWLIDEFKKDQGIDLRNDRQALQRLKEAAEKAKIELSSTQQTEVNLPFITADQSGPKHLVMTLTRSKLEQLVGDLVDKTTSPVKQALKDAGHTADQINEVVLVGGQTRMPLVDRRDPARPARARGRARGGRRDCRGRARSVGGPVRLPPEPARGLALSRRRSLRSRRLPGPVHAGRQGGRRLADVRARRCSAARRGGDRARLPRRA